MLQKGVEGTYISDEEGSWVGSLITLGACFGAFPTGYLSNCLGRKRILQMLAFPMILSWMLIAFGFVILFKGEDGYKLNLLLLAITCGLITQLVYWRDWQLEE